MATTCHNNDQKGDGILNFISKKLNTVRPKALNTFLHKEGKQIITKIEVCRIPVSSVMQGLLNVLSFGKFKRQLKKLNYDTTYHLYLTLHLSNGKIYSIEKNQRVTIIDGVKSGGECRQMIYGTKHLNDFLLTAEHDHSGERFYRYDGFKNNCQQWVKDILNSNGIYKFDTFIMQDVSELVPTYLKKFSKGTTDVLALFDYVHKGGAMKGTKQNIIEVRFRRDLWDKQTSELYLSVHQLKSKALERRGGEFVHTIKNKFDYNEYSEKRNIKQGIVIKYGFK